MIFSDFPVPLLPVEGRLLAARFPAPAHLPEEVRLRRRGGGVRQAPRQEERQQGTLHGRGTQKDEIMEFGFFN